MGQTVKTLKLRPELTELERAQAWIAEAGEAFELTPPIMYALELCCEEAVSNVIRHGMATAEPAFGTIEVLLWRSADLLHFRVVDPGPAFDPTAAPGRDAPAALEDAKIGGLGIHLLQNFTQALRYERVENKNQLTMDFLLTPATASN